MSLHRNIAILGSTGSIGTQALEVVQNNPDKFTISVLTANNQAELLIQQARQFRPDKVIIANEEKYPLVKSALSDLGIIVEAGSDALAYSATGDQIDMVLTALVGFAGLRPTVNAINSGKNIALANKETLVVAGQLIMDLASENKVEIIPVDSEHSALFQCLVGEKDNPIEKIYLTASGGPFRGYTHEQLKSVTRTEALKHPNWEMGAKITIDSASMMNKGLEVIEAFWLFNLEIDQIDVVVHPQSIIHSIVQFHDGSMKAQMGLPDMKLPIQYALAYPQRLKSNFPRFRFPLYPSLTFEEADKEVFKNLGLAYDALKTGGNAPCILNAANEVTNLFFRQDKIGFLEIAEINEYALNEIPHIDKPEFEDLNNSDKATRKFVRNYLKERVE